MLARLKNEYSRLKKVCPKNSQNRNFQTKKKTYFDHPRDLEKLARVPPPHPSQVKIRRMRGLSPLTTPPRCFFLLLLFFLSAHNSFPTKKKYTCFTACQYLVGVYIKEIANFFFFFWRFSRHHCEEDLERKTRAMRGEQVLQAIKEIKNTKWSKAVSFSISMSLFLVENKREKSY